MAAPNRNSVFKKITKHFYKFLPFGDKSILVYGTSHKFKIELSLT
jgi:hypothetical protein